MHFSRRSTVIPSTPLGMRRSSAEFLNCEPLPCRKGRNGQAQHAVRRSRRYRRGLSLNGQPPRELPFDQGFVRAVPLLKSDFVPANEARRESVPIPLHSSFWKLQPLGLG